MSFHRAYTILPGNTIFAIKVDPLHLESQNQAKKISVGLPSSLIKNWGKSAGGSWVMIGKTNRAYNYINIKL